VHFFIELKCESIERFDSAMVLERTRQALKGLEGMCTLISFSTEIIAMAQVQELSTGLIVESWDQKSGMVEKPDYLFCNIKHLPASGNLHVSGTQLAIYEIDDVDVALALAARGVDFVETFTIGEMHTALTGC